MLSDWIFCAIISIKDVAIVIEGFWLFDKKAKIKANVHKKTVVWNNLALLCTPGY